MNLTGAPVEQVQVSAVNIGVRRRKTLGRLEPLQRSIMAHGLIHPIVLRNGNELVAGGRRLEACMRLGWKTIPARRVEVMSDEELRAIEMEENSERLALNDFESSKARLAEIRQAEADLKHEAEEEKSRRLNSAKPAKIKPDEPAGRGGVRAGAGRPSTGKVSRKIVASVTGIPDASQRRIEDHVAIAEKYPVLQRPGWVQHQVLHAGAELAKLPEPERPKAAALIDQDAISPKKTIAILENLATLPAPERKEIFKLAQSPDEHDRGNALSRAAALPDNPDPGLLLLGNAADTLRRAVKACRTEALKAPLAELAASAARLDAEFSKRK